MAMFRENASLTSVSNMILPGVWACAGRAEAEGIPIAGADVFVDFVTDDLKLRVTHRLVSRADVRDPDFPNIIGDRIKRALRLFHRMPAAKALRVDRRRLIARGEKARKEANRPVRKKRAA